MKKFTIFALTVAITAVFAVSAMANEWNLYGSARVSTFYDNRDLGKTLAPTANPRAFVAVDRRDIANDTKVQRTVWNLQNNARIGAKVKGENLEAQFEFGARFARRAPDDFAGSTGATNFANIRRLYGVWKFADGWGLKVGKDYTPMTFFLSGQVWLADNGMLQTGNAYGARKGLLELDGELGPGLLKVALIDSSTSTLGTPNSKSETVIPKLEASYNWKITDMMSVHGFGGYQTYKVKTANLNPLQSSTDSFNVNSWMLGVGGDLNFGPFFVRPQVSYYSNGTEAGWLTGMNSASSKSGVIAAVNAATGENIPLIGSDDVLTSKTLMAMLAFGFKATESLGLEAGVGYVGYETDSYQNNSLKNNFLEYYLNAVITLAPGVYLVPEVGYRDFGKNEGDRSIGIVAPDTDNGSLFYAGAKWQIDF